MFKLIPTTQFKKDLKKIKKQSGTNFTSISGFLEVLQLDGALGINKKHKAHKLTGNYKGNWEAHIKPDLLIIWFEINEAQEIILLRVGSHSELF
ncbi:MAG TPA: type II toxin-antitoxin system YafQ family toxin [Pelobium sp.]|nr:type II toxin-antitoxin system YafQ family toxin [Pelobium sp.]